MRKFLILLCSVIFIFSGNALASSDIAKQQDKKPQNVKVKFEEGDLVLTDLLDASELISKAVSSKHVHKNIPGTIVEIKGKKYEVRFFSFEDTSGNLPADKGFGAYAKEKQLLELPSIKMNPLPGITFLSFDYRRAKLGDGVYFSMAVRLVE